MDRLEALRIFLAVLDRRSFADASRALHLSRAAVTRAVARVEEELGVLLLDRTTRSVQPTVAGTVYGDRCRRILADLEEARTAVRGEDAAPRGTLSITAPVVFGRLHVLPVVETLTTRNPDLSVRFTLMDRVASIVEEGFDLAVRIGMLADSALVAVPVSSTRPVLVASPGYLEAEGEPATPADLRHARIISFEGIGETNTWRFGHEGKASVTVRPRIAVNTADAAIAAAIHGHGITRALSYQVHEAVADGRLRRVLTDHETGELTVSIVYSANRRGSPNVTAFVRAARSYFSERRWIP